MGQLALRIYAHKSFSRAFEFANRLVHFNQLLLKLSIHQAQVPLFNLGIFNLCVQLP